MVAMAKVIQRVISAPRHGIPRRGIDHNVRVIAYTQLFKCSFELFRGGKFRVIAFNEILQRQKARPWNVATLILRALFTHMQHNHFGIVKMLAEPLRGDNHLMMDCSIAGRGGSVRRTGDKDDGNCGSTLKQFSDHQF